MGVGSLCLSDPTCASPILRCYFCEYVVVCGSLPRFGTLVNEERDSTEDVEFYCVFGDATS